jgi:hypothetical protein
MLANWPRFPLCFCISRRRRLERGRIAKKHLTRPIGTAALALGLLSVTPCPMGHVVLTRVRAEVVAAQKQADAVVEFVAAQRGVSGGRQALVITVCGTSRFR